jgi:anti-sigma factor RsiW
VTAIRSVTDLRALRKRLVELRSIGNVIAPRVAERFSALARADFDARRGPSGKPWKPNKRGKVPTLRRTGTLENAAATFRAIGSTVLASVLGVRYARFQNPSRFVPSSKKLSPERSAIVEQIAEEEISRAVRGGL